MTDQVDCMSTMITALNIELDGDAETQAANEQIGVAELQPPSPAPSVLDRVTDFFSHNTQRIEYNLASLGPYLASLGPYLASLAPYLVRSVKLTYPVAVEAFVLYHYYNNSSESFSRAGLSAEEQLAFITLFMGLLLCHQVQTIAKEPVSAPSIRP